MFLRMGMFLSLRFFLSKNLQFILKVPVLLFMGSLLGKNGDSPVWGILRSIKILQTGHCVKLHRHKLFSCFSKEMMHVKQFQEITEVA